MLLLLLTDFYNNCYLALHLLYEHYNFFEIGLLIAIGSYRQMAPLSSAIRVKYAYKIETSFRKIEKYQFRHSISPRLARVYRV